VISFIRQPLSRLWQSGRTSLNTVDWTPGLWAILVVYFVQGAISLARLAVSFFLKDQLGLSPAEVAALTGITVIPWTVKPIYGWLSDSLPIARYRRRPYLMVSAILSCTSWLAMAFWVSTPLTATAMVLLGSLGVAIGDVIVDSLVVERSRSQDWAGTGTLQSLTWGFTALGSLVTAYLGGALLERYPPQVVFGLTAALPLLILAVAGLIEEEPMETRMGWDPVKQQMKDVWQAMRQPRIYLPVLFVFLWQATPSSESAFFYFVTNDLHFGPEFLGQVRLASSLASLAGVFAFQTWLRRQPLRPLFGWITLISCGLGLTSLILVYHLNRDWGIDDHWFSLGDSVILTVAGQIAFMPVLVLAARLCPPGIEATLFALLMSLFNLAGAISHELGSLVMHLLGVTESQFGHLDQLVWITNLSTLLPLVFLGWLPAKVSEVDPYITEAEDLEEAQTVDSPEEVAATGVK